jgi:protein-arginine kinase activator protein McsA
VRGGSPPPGKELRFEYAAKLRDEIKELRRELQALAA